jgi:hypothetical protein
MFQGGEAARQMAEVLGPREFSVKCTIDRKSLTRISEFFIAVEDDARVHVGALLHPNVRNERLFAFASPFTWPELIQAMQKKFPDRKFETQLADPGVEMTKIPVERALDVHTWVRKLGNDWHGGEGWTPLDIAVGEGIEGMEKDD